MPLQRIQLFMRPVMLLICVIAVTTLAGVNLGSAQTLPERIKALTDELEKLKSADGETATQIVRLRGEIDKIQCDKVECKLELLKQFAKAINEDKVVTPENVTRDDLNRVILPLVAAFAKLGGAYHSDLTAQNIALAVTQALKTPQEAGTGDAAPISEAIRILQKWQSPTASATNRAADLHTLLESPTDKPQFDDAKLAAALVVLGNAIAMFEAPNSSAEHRLKELRGLIARTEKKPDKATFHPELIKLAGEIAAFVEPDDALVPWTQQLQVVLGKKPKSTDAIVTALNSLSAAIKTYEQRVGPDLNIIQAYYGDFRFVRKAFAGRLRIDSSTGMGWRVCDATAEIRANCQGKKSCPFTSPKDPAKLEITGTTLCGEDPVPHAGKSSAGVVIEFQCASLTKTEWTDLDRRPRPAGPSKVERAVLRSGTTAVIDCRSAAQD